MKLWVCSFPGAEHPHLGCFSEHKAAFGVSCRVIRAVLERSNPLLQCQPLKLESAKEAAGSRASPAGQAAKWTLLCLIIVSFVLLVGLVLPTFPEETSLISKNFFAFRDKQA